MRPLTVALVATQFALSAALHGLPAHASSDDALPVEALPVEAPPVDALPVDALPAHTYEGQVVAITNDHRALHDLRPLRPDACLARFANRHAAQMARQQRTFHQDLSPISRLCGLSRVGENVAYGYSNGRRVVNGGWMRSPGHRDNILTRPFRLVAVGAAKSDTGRWYTAQVLGRR